MSHETTIPTMDALRSLGFQHDPRVISDECPGLSFDFGNSNEGEKFIRSLDVQMNQSIFSGKMTCDPLELARSGSYPGIQGQLAAAERDVLRWASWPQISGIAIPLMCSLPWLWYFFLRRIRELREAIVGK
jgi:hypothetical protein